MALPLPACLQLRASAPSAAHLQARRHGYFCTPPSPPPRSLYNNIIPPSRLSPGSDLHLFREGIEPKWEVRWHLHCLPTEGCLGDVYR